MAEQQSERNPVDGLADLFVFAPLGLALSARELIPELAERGREFLTGPADVAKLVGQFAVRQGPGEVGRLADRTRDQIGTILEGVLRGWAAGTDGAGAAPAAEPSPTSAEARPRPAPARSSGPGAAALAIPEYDSLSASQVLPRLVGLTPEELEAVRSYEAAHRGRRTILGRIEQLQGG